MHGSAALPPWIRCPVCKGPLTESAQSIDCAACHRSHAVEDGIPDLTVRPAAQHGAGSASLAESRGRAIAWRPMTDALERFDGPPSCDGRFLDLCARSPELLVEAHRHFDEVVVIGPSRLLLEATRARVRAAGASDIRFLHADLDALPIASRTVLCFHLDAPSEPEADLEAVLSELHRVLQPDGCGFARHRLTPAAEVARASRHAFQEGHRLLGSDSRLARWTERLGASRLLSRVHVDAVYERVRG